MNLEEAEEGRGFVSGRVARLSHAILRQLRVTVGRSKATVYHELPSKAGGMTWMTRYGWRIAIGIYAFR